MVLVGKKWPSDHEFLKIVFRLPKNWPYIDTENVGPYVANHIIIRSYKVLLIFLLNIFY